MSKMENFYKSRLINQLMGVLVAFIAYYFNTFEIAVMIILGIIMGNQSYKELKDEQ